METKRPSRFRYTRKYGIATAIVLVLVIKFGFSGEPSPMNIGYGKFKQLLATPTVRFDALKVSPTEITGEVRFTAPVPDIAASEGEQNGPHKFRTSRAGVEQDQGLYALLDHHAPGAYTASAEKPIFVSVLQYAGMSLAMALSILLVIFVSRWWLSGGSSPFAFMRGRHRLMASTDLRLTFDEVAGIDEAKAELQEVVDFLREPDKYTKLGGRIPKGVLLVGPPGTGKTLLAKSVAGEADVPFFSISGSDFVEMFVGVGASRVRDLFREAMSKAPCIVFIDELDAMGRSRSGNTFGPQEEREQTLNQLLVEMDGFGDNNGVIIMAATNRPEILDAALLRPGRFDRIVVVDRPDINGREAILRVHLRRVNTLATNVDVRKLAGLTPGTVGADLANIVNEAALMTARRGGEQIEMRDFEEAIERGAVGLQRKSRIMRPEEQRLVAIHEAGHALVACAIEHSDPVHKVSIIPRGFAGGYVLQRQQQDRTMITRRELEAQIKVALGGTVAEELMLGDISTGATSDLKTANRIAMQMVREYGMSRIGRVYLSGSESAFLPSAGLSEAVRDHSEQTAREVDLEVRSIIHTCLHEVRAVLEAGCTALDAVACALVEREVLEDRELFEILHTHQFRISPTAKRNLLHATPSLNGSH
jgi:cell division protease FtsH